MRKRRTYPTTFGQVVIGAALRTPDGDVYVKRDEGLATAMKCGDHYAFEDTDKVEVFSYLAIRFGS